MEHKHEVYYVVECSTCKEVTTVKSDGELVRCKNCSTYYASQFTIDAGGHQIMTLIPLEDDQYIFD